MQASAAASGTAISAFGTDFWAKKLRAHLIRLRLQFGLLLSISHQHDAVHVRATQDPRRFQHHIQVIRHAMRACI